MAPRLTIAGLALGLAGCALVLDASTELGAHCNFNGSEDTACGTCIVQHCQPRVDQCCAQEVCDDDLDYLDDCAGGDVLACAQLTLAGELGECVSGNCTDACITGESPSFGGSS